MEITDQISDADATALGETYETFLEERQSLLDALAAQQTQSAARREILADAVILGVLHHLHEVANNKELYRERLLSYGGAFPSYAKSLVSEVVLLFKQLPHDDTPPVPPVQSGPGGGAPPAVRRRVSRP